ncbi:hypothetical protein [Nocardioides sediminis]|uniref:hypothetical protein n=1 Tax=Nocardioides sediminis TaxID=433648 RepID=UPI00131EF2CF|nr:hypothetical protein [Nocardioides sediminis]
MAGPEQSHGAGRAGGLWRAREVAVVVVAVVPVVVAVVAWAVVGTEPPRSAQRVPGTAATSTSVEAAAAVPGWRWTDPPRPRTRHMVAVESQEIGNAISATLEDGLDADAAWVDIEVVTATRDPQWKDNWRWTLELGAAPPRASASDPSRGSVAYGLALDGDGDLEADCMIGLDDEAPARGDHRVWVTDVGTGATEVRDHPPYGLPADFLHPLERAAPWVFDEPTVLFLFQSGRGPCEPLGPWASF